MKLYDYFRSSAAYRVRIALNLKNVAPERASVHLRRGAQRADDYLAMNPQGLVPALVTEGGDVLTQSLAIIEWLEESYPKPALLPGDAAGRARVRSLALGIACDIHPLNNLRVLNYLTGTLGVTDAQRDGWCRYWCDVGLEALETRLARESATGAFCHGGSADDRRYLPRAAACQRAPRGPRSRTVSDAASDRVGVCRIAGFRQCRAGEATGCRVSEAKRRGGRE
jgi:maleylacetoacetate isomerase